MGTNFEGVFLRHAELNSEVLALHSKAQESLSEGIAVHFLNAFSLACASRDETLRQALTSNRAINLPDGKPLSWIGVGASSKLTQVRGPKFFESSLVSSKSSATRHFFLGSTEETLARIQAKCKAQTNGKIRVVGAYSPQFGEFSETEREKIDSLILNSNANVVWVGLGTPKQDFEVEYLASKFPVIAIAVGAAFDFYAEVKKESPDWMRTLYLEWLFRLLSEPRRLWRRYFWGNTVFLFLLLRHTIRNIQAKEK